MKQPCVYILASAVNGTLYIGVTSDLWNRMAEHTKGLLDGFTKRYDVKLLVCYEFQESMEKAIKRELRIKKWERLWKIRLIEAMNPEWANLYDSEIRAIASGSAGRQAQEKPDEPDE